MSNPTITVPSQFTQPFNILPDLVYTNPTINNTQFNDNFDLPGPGQQSNPTSITPTQFSSQNIGGGGYLGNPTAETIILPNIAANAVVTTAIPQFRPQNIQQASWAAPTEFIHTNVSLKSTANNIFGFASLAAGSLIGIPQIGQVGQSLTEGFENTLSGTYTTLPLSKLTNRLFPGAQIGNANINMPVLYPDFRSRLNISQDSANSIAQQTLAYITSRRLDGASAATRGSVYAGIYAAAAVTPIGPYSIFNLDGAGKTGYGWGEHDNPNAIRKDFTMRSHIAKQWIPGIDQGFASVIENTADTITVGGATPGKFRTTRLPNEMATPFRGDKVNVIDFNKRTLNQAYLWKPSLADQGLGASNPLIDELLNNAGLTQDFIKFYFTGPKLQAGNTTDKDDIIVFRAVLTTLSDSFQPQWNPVSMIGRADPNYIYSQVARDLSLNFDIYATDRDEMQSIYRKLNALAGYTSPTYNSDSIAMEAPWMRITIGDLFVQTPVIMNSLTFDFAVTDAPWEINIEQDPNMMQVPFKIGVSCGFNVISDFLPQKGGRFYTLAKRFAIDGTPLAGNDNWLSDFKGNLSLEEVRRKFKRPGREKIVGNESNVKTETVDNNVVQNGLNTLNKLRIK